MNTPYHVPWVWSEMLLTYSNGQFELTGRGSVFPTHCWFVNGKKVAEQGQVSVGTSLEATKLLKVMKKGAPSKPWTPLLGASLPQCSLSDEEKLRGQKVPIEKHPYTVEGGDPISYRWNPFAAPDFVKMLRQGA
jgi:hypothetical protein